MLNKREWRYSEVPDKVATSQNKEPTVGGEYDILPGVLMLSYPDLLGAGLALGLHGLVFTSPASPLLGLLADQYPFQSAGTA